MKPLSTDSLYELQIISHKPKEKSVLSLFNRANTYQGRDKIQALLRLPLASIEHIKQRQYLIQFTSLHLQQFTIDVSQGYLTAAQNHLASNLAGSDSKNPINRLRQTQWLKWFQPYDYSQLQSGVAALKLVLQIIEQRTAWWRKQNQLPQELKVLAQRLTSFFDLTGTILSKPLSQVSVLEIDYALRYQYAEGVKAIFDVFYQLDAYCGIARFLVTQNWTYPDFIEGTKPLLSIISLKHPFLRVSESFLSVMMARWPL